MFTPCADKIVFKMAKTEKRSRTKKDVDPVDEQPDKAEGGIKKIGRCFEVPGCDSELDMVHDNSANVRHFYIELLDGGTVALELIDANGDPSGNILEEGVALKNFSLKYKSCSEHDCPLQSRTVDEIAQKMSQTRSDMAEEHLKNNDFEKAEETFKRSLKFDENNMQALVGLGKTHMEQDRVDEAMAVFKKIGDSNALYEESNKHTFNDFAIYLRKNDLIDQAIENYEKAIMLDPQDEILYYNLGRAKWENKEMQTAIQKLREGLKIADGKKRKFAENQNATDKNDEDLEEEKKYLIESADVATRILDLYMKSEKEMLEQLFSNQKSENTTADNTPPQATSHTEQSAGEDSETVKTEPRPKTVKSNIVLDK
ncbi:hypothetical protein MNBD_NITROSPINAE01-72 [hydrothermal vent metagenome]|uniref:Uncharacterized protein n=1 Tax=hydrothermal vent metagenome TaxID=652676 RepID=A0A3B1CIS0_9ZZZZ